MRARSARVRPLRPMRPMRRGIRGRAAWRPRRRPLGRRRVRRPCRAPRSGLPPGPAGGLPALPALRVDGAAQGVSGAEADGAGCGHVDGFPGAGVAPGAGRAVPGLEGAEARHAARSRRVPRASPDVRRGRPSPRAPGVCGVHAGACGDEACEFAAVHSWFSVVCGLASLAPGPARRPGGRSADGARPSEEDDCDAPDPDPADDGSAIFAPEFPRVFRRRFVDACLHRRMTAAPVFGRPSSRACRQAFVEPGLAPSEPGPAPDPDPGPQPASGSRSGSFSAPLTALPARGDAEADGVLGLRMPRARPGGLAAAGLEREFERPGVAAHVAVEAPCEGVFAV